jgi:hypothetical protein
MIIVFLYSISSAQNARVEALGGNFILDDVGKVAGYPASGNSYGDFVQASSYFDGSFGPAIGVKKLGEWGAVGIIANQGSTLLSNFYTDAKTFLDSLNPSTDSLPSSIISYPHLLFTFRLSRFSIGFDFFYELSNTKYSYMSNNQTMNHYNARITNWGGLISAGIDFGVISVHPIIDFSFPKVAGEALIEIGEPLEKRGTVTNQSFAYGGGLEIDAGFSAINLCIGAYLSNEMYKFYREQKYMIYSPKYQSLLLNGYCGLEAWPSDHLMLSLGYSIDNMTDKSITQDSVSGGHFTINNVFITTTNFIVASAEYVVKENRIVDALAFRGGINWSLTNKQYKYQLDSASYSDHEEIRLPSVMSDVSPTIGIGIEKFGFILDLSAKLGEWSGILSGPSVVMGTLTYRYKK